MQHTKIYQVPLYSVLFVAVGALSACAPFPKPDPQAALSVVASFYPLAFIAHEIGGEDVAVMQMTPAGVEPHDFEPSPQQIASIHSANLFLLNGAGIDTWGEKIMDDVRARGVLVVRMSDVIPMMRGDASHDDEHHAGDEHKEADGISSLDPHIWLSPVLMMRQAELVRDVLVQADPERADDYKKRTDVLLSNLKKLDEEFTSGLASCKKDAVVVSHNAFEYLAQEYGFRTIPVSGLSPQEDPSPKRIAELADFAKKQNIQYIFFETLLSSKFAQTIADEIGAQALVLNPIEGLTESDMQQAKNYISQQRENLTNLRIALQCQ